MTAIPASSLFVPRASFSPRSARSSPWSALSRHRTAKAAKRARPRNHRNAAIQVSAQALKLKPEWSRDSRHLGVFSSCYSSFMLPVFPLLALLSLAASAATAPPQKSFDEIARQADRARFADRMTEAISLYREGVRLRPSWNEGWLWLGNLLYDQDRFPEAQASFTHFLALAPKPGPVWALKGLCEFELRDFAHSLQDLDTWVHGNYHGDNDLTDVAAFHWALLLTRERHFAQALYLLADRAQHKGESPLLVEAMGLASLRLPNLPEDYPPEFRERVWLAGKAAFYTSGHEFDHGQEYARRLLSAYGQQPEVHYFQGTLLKLQRMPAEAAQEFRKELQISPQHASAMLELAQIDIDFGQLNEAVSLARHAAQLEPTNPDTHHILGRALLVAGQAAESAQELELAERLAPDASAIHFHLAKAYQGLGRKEDAQREMAAYVSIKKKEGILERPQPAQNTEHPLEAPK